MIVRELFGYSFATWRFHLRGEAIRGPHDVGWMRDLSVRKLMRADVPTLPATLTIAVQAGRTGRKVYVAENHSVVGGLGEAVAGLLMRSGVHPAFAQIALPDRFLDAGALPTLHDRYGISASAVASRVKADL